jgi:hypothetical protein
MIDKNDLSKKITTAIRSVTESTEGEEYTFKSNVDMNKLKIQLSESLSMLIGSNPKNLKCKGFRLYFVDTKSQVLLTEGLFVKDFSPEDWNTDEKD